MFAVRIPPVSDSVNCDPVFRFVEENPVITYAQA
jgi:hypothetical protein